MEDVGAKPQSFMEEIGNILNKSRQNERPETNARSGKRSDDSIDDKASIDSDEDFKSLKKSL